MTCPRAARDELEPRIVVDSDLSPMDGSEPWERDAMMVVALDLIAQIAEENSDDA